MSTEEENQIEQEGEADVQETKVEPTPPQPKTEPAAGAQPPAQVQKKDVVEMPVSAFKKVKADAAARGAKQAMQQFLQKFGVTTEEELLQKLQPAQQKPETSKNAEQERSRLKQLEIEKAQLEKKLARTRVESALRATAQDLGLRNTDFALQKLRNKLQSMSTRERARFDTNNFFAELQKNEPEIFAPKTATAPVQAKKRVVNTGAGSDAATSAPQNAPSVGSKQINAMDMSKSEFENALRELGVHV